MFDINDPEGRVGHELKVTLPGVPLVCGDSHPCTHGGVGALTWGVGTSEVRRVLHHPNLRGASP